METFEDLTEFQPFLVLVKHLFLLVADPSVGFLLAVSSLFPVLLVDLDHCLELARIDCCKRGLRERQVGRISEVKH